MRVLVVDDEPLVRERLRALLAAHPDVAVVGERDGKKGPQDDAEIVILSSDGTSSGSSARLDSEASPRISSPISRSTCMTRSASSR